MIQQGDSKEAYKSEQGTLSADSSYPLSQILTVVGAGKSTYLYRSITTHTTDSLPCSFHFGRGGVHWQRGLPEAPCYPTMVCKLLATK